MQDKREALMIAAGFSKFEQVVALLDQDVDPNIRNEVHLQVPKLCSPIPEHCSTVL